MLLEVFVGFRARHDLVREFVDDRTHLVGANADGDERYKADDTYYQRHQTFQDSCCHAFWFGNGLESEINKDFSKIAVSRYTYHDTGKEKAHSGNKPKDIERSRL